MKNEPIKSIGRNQESQGCVWVSVHLSGSVWACMCVRRGWREEGGVFTHELCMPICKEIRIRQDGDIRLMEKYD